MTALHTRLSVIDLVSDHPITGSPITRSLCGPTAKKRKGRPQPDSLFFQGRIVLTVARKSIRTFWQKSYEGLKGSVKEFLDNKHICFQQLKLQVNKPSQNDKK
jgi:hypothetical protein